MKLLMLALLAVGCTGCLDDSWTEVETQPESYTPKLMLENATTNLESMIELRQYPIVEVQHENTSPNIGLIVSPKWYELSAIDKENMAIQIRDKWASECECGAFTILFGTTDSEILGRISTLGNPHFN